MTIEELTGWLKNPQRSPLVMAVLNVTPDSFSDGGRYFSAESAVERAWELLAEGADWIDIGGESTRPGSEPVPPDEQLRRVLPVVEALAKTGAVLSVDTTSARVAEAALEAGASVINDITAAQGDPQMPAVMTRARAAVLMHMQGEPGTMQQSPHYGDVVAEVEAYLLDRALALEAAGVPRERILLDPGIGFGKTLRHNLELLSATQRLAAHGYPLLIGTSRKRFIGTITGEPVAEQRLFGTAATVAWCIGAGAAIVRVHDAKPMRQVVDMTLAVKDPDRYPEELPAER